MIRIEMAEAILANNSASRRAFRSCAECRAKVCESAVGSWPVVKIVVSIDGRYRNVMQSFLLIDVSFDTITL